MPGQLLALRRLHVRLGEVTLDTVLSVAGLLFWLWMVRMMTSSDKVVVSVTIPTFVVANVASCWPSIVFTTLPVQGPQGPCGAAQKAGRQPPNCDAASLTLSRANAVPPRNALRDGRCTKSPT